MARSPLAVVLLATASGIVVDRFHCLSLWHWLLLSVLALSASWQARRNSTRATAYVLCALAATGGGWHHLHWSVFAANEISRFGRSTTQPCNVRVKATRNVVELPLGGRGKRRFRIVTKATQLEDRGSWRAVSGFLTVEIQADARPQLKAGDEFQASGKLLGISRPTNPAAFDYRQHSRSRRALCRLLVASPQSIQLIRHARISAGSLIRWLRRRAKRTLEKHFSKPTRDLLAAMLIGVREPLSSEQLQPYLTSGTIHLFSVSGLHVGVLAGALWAITHLLGLGPRPALLLVASVVVGFALICDARAPVVRATALVVTLCGSRLFGRPAFSLNNLSAAALSVVFWNPAQLFQTGTHLSFLAVTALGWMANKLHYGPPADSLNRLIWETRPLPVRVVRFAIWTLVQCWLTSLVVWLVTLPLAANQFHIVSFVAPWLQPFLWLPLLGTLLSGFATLLIDPLVPWLATWTAVLCEQSFNCMNLIVIEANRIPGGYIWTSGFHVPWTHFCYLILLPLGWWLAGHHFVRSVIGLLAIVVCGTLISAKPIVRHWSKSDELKCTVLNVRHGLAIVIELPNRRVLVYDCGSLGNRNLAANTMQQFLWQEGIEHIDQLVISHGDADHYNSTPRLLKRTSIGQVTTPPGMLQKKSLKWLAKVFQQSGIAVRELTSRSQLVLDDNVTIDVLHPPPQFSPENDNAASLVIRLQYGSQSILLPGDLEGSGLEKLQTLVARHCTVVISPHHGAPASNPPSFIHWCSPSAMVVSGRRSNRIERLLGQVGRLCKDIYVTGEHGAVSVTMTRDRTEIRTGK